MTVVKWNRARQNGSQTPTVDRDLSTLFPSFFNGFSHPFGSQDFFREFFNDSYPAKTGVVGRNIPAVNISETENEYVIEVAAPGMQKKDFRIEMDGDLLHLSYKKEEKAENKESNHWRKEFSYESFERSFTLPKIVDGDKIGATYNDGILKISVPKKEEAKKKPARTIDIQ
jgi:HSP20 family protein